MLTWSVDILAMYTHLDVSNHDSNMHRRGTGIRALVIAVYMYVTTRDMMNMCVYIYIYIYI